MTLTEFLLARIAEDEQRAREDGADAMVGWRWKHYPEEAYKVVQGLTLENSRHVLAVCEAHRRIVEDSAHLSALPHGPLRSHAEWVVATLALPYAEHPDFREEWRL